MKPQKSTIYPHNHVYQSESGHFIEIDDNAGTERVSVNHRSGSFFEFHPNGDFVTTINNNNFQTVNGQNHVVVYGFSTISVGKNLKLLVNSSKNETTEEESYDLDIEVDEGANVNISIKKGNCNICIDEGDVNLKMEKGDMKITQEDGDFIHRVNGNYRLDVEGQMDVIVGGNLIQKISGSRSTFIEGVLDYCKMDNDNAHFEIEGNKESRRMKSDIYLKSDNFVSRAEKNVILETVSDTGGSGNIVLNSSGNIDIASGWDSSRNSESMAFAPNINIYTHKSGNIKLFSDNSVELYSKGTTKFQIDSIFSVKTSLLLKNWTEGPNPQSVQVPNYASIFSPKYAQINYNDIMNNGFKSITI